MNPAAPSKNVFISLTKIEQTLKKAMAEGISRGTLIPVNTEESCNHYNHRVPKESGPRTIKKSLKEFCITGPVKHRS